MSEHTAEILNWSLTGACGAFTVGRYVIRRYSLGRWSWDDLAHLFAFLVLVAHGITEHYTTEAKKPNRRHKAGKIKLSEAQQLANYQHLSRLNRLNNCFLHLCFWLVKLTFLLFYRFLFKTSSAFKKVWWGVLVFVLLTFWVPIAGVLATCGGAKTLDDYKKCNSPTKKRAEKLIYSCVANVLTDVAIMVLPFWMLKNLQVRRRQKAALAFIFSFAIFCIILDILRTVQALRSKQALYTVLELNLNVMIACLPTYRALLNMEHLRKFSLISKLSSWASSKASFGKNSYGKNDTWESKDSEGHSLGSSGSLSSTNRDYPASVAEYSKSYPAKVQERERGPYADSV